MSKDQKRVGLSHSLQGGLLVCPELTEKLTGILSMNSPRVSFLAGDGSDRSYYRVKDAGGVGTAVLMYLSEKDSELVGSNQYDWTHIRETLETAGLPVPQLLAKLPEHQVLVIQDCGDHTLETTVLQSTTPSDRILAYQKPTEYIARMLMIKADPDALWQTRAFDYEKFQFELNFFYQHYVIGFMGEKGIQAELKSRLLEDFSQLSQWLASKSRFFTHRDYHSRNILVDKGRWSLIDFQDARIGPASYDLVSLAFDPYVDLAVADRQSIMSQGYLQIKDLSGAMIATELEESWRACALQRIIKALGSFAFLTLVKKRGDYLTYSPRALTILREIGIADGRWPFLSGEFLAILQNHLESTGTYV